MCKVPIIALHQILADERYKDRNLRREIGHVIKRSDSTISRVLDEKARLDQDQSSDLGRYFCDDLQDTRWSHCFVGNTHIILPKRFARANGRHDDEACEYLEAGGTWVQQMTRGDKDFARRTLDRIEGVILPRMRAETDTL